MIEFDNSTLQWSIALNIDLSPPAMYRLTLQTSAVFVEYSLITPGAQCSLITRTRVRSGIGQAGAQHNIHVVDTVHKAPDRRPAVRIEGKDRYDGSLFMLDILWGCGGIWPASYPPRAPTPR